MKAVDKVRDALPTEASQWTTVDLLVAATELTRETVRRHLKALEGSGFARCEKGDDNDWWRARTEDDVDVPDEAFDADPMNAPAPEGFPTEFVEVGPPVQDHDLEEPPAENGPESPVEATDPPTGTDGPKSPDSPASDELSRVLAGLQSARPTVVAALAEQLRPETATCTHPGCGQTLTKAGRVWNHDGPADHKGTTKAHYTRKGRTGNCTYRYGDGKLCGLPVHTEGRTWVHDEPSPFNADHEATTKRTREPGRDANNVEFRKGELTERILDLMRANPDTEYTPGEVTKALGAHNASSVAYAMDKAAGNGELIPTSLRPYRYKAA